MADYPKDISEDSSDDVLTEKPVLFSDTRTDAEKFDPRQHRGTLDPTRIPGYAEIVQANDIAKADDLIFREQNLGRTKEDLYRQIGAQPQELPVEFKWLRVSGPGGGESHNALRELDGYRTQEGFRPVANTDFDTGERFERLGYGFPSTGRKAEDGLIHWGPDVALFVREGEVARNWEKFYAEETSRMEGAGIPHQGLPDRDSRGQTGRDRKVATWRLYRYVRHRSQSSGLRQTRHLAEERRSPLQANLDGS